VSSEGAEKGAENMAENTNEKIVQEILHELFSSLEVLDTQSTAILQFLHAKGIGSEADLAPYFEEAGNASSVRWRAVRVRIDYLISSALTAAERDGQKETPKQNREEAKNPDTEPSRSQATEEGVQGAQPVAPNNKAEANDVSASSDKTQKSPGNNADANADANEDAEANKHTSKRKDDADRATGQREKNAA
jgi:hypothetical protein